MCYMDSPICQPFLSSLLTEQKLNEIASSERETPCHTHGRQNSKIRRVTREHGSSDSFMGWNSKEYLGGSNSITCHLSGTE